MRTFVIITTDANELVAQIHNRMPVLAPHEYKRWLGDDPDPRDLLRISTRVNKPENDKPSILEPVKLVSSAA